MSRLLVGVLDGRRQRYATGGGEREGEEEGRESERLSVRTGKENSPPASEGDAGLDKPNGEASVSEKKAVAGYSFEELLEKISRAKLRRDERNFQNQHPVAGVAREQRKHREKTRHVESIEELVEFLRDENATDICVIRIPPEREYVEYFVVCSGFGTRHIHTVADNLAAEVNAKINKFNRFILMATQKRKRVLSKMDFIYTNHR